MSFHRAVGGCGSTALGRNATNFMFRNFRNSILSIQNTGNTLHREIQHAKVSNGSNRKTLRASVKAQNEDLPKTKIIRNKTLTSKKKGTADDLKKLTRKADIRSVDKGVEEKWDFFNSTRPNVKEIEDAKTHDIFKPVEVSARRDTVGLDIGAELTGSKIHRRDLLNVLAEFCNQSKTQILAAEHGLDVNLFQKSFNQFRRYCVETDELPVELHITFSDILAGAGHVDDIFPYFLQHAKKVYPHLECIEDLRKISDLTEPAQWYPMARNLKRKIIYHAGPTNSGKTYHALKRFVEAKSGVYCGPLRMLAVEVFNKCNLTKTPCDLVTGEDRRQANPEGPAEHVACTVEMTNISKHYEVAVIDEIQMLRDQSRGWAWTRALHGICADEVHLCGEGSALDIVKTMAELCGDSFEMRGYNRLTKLTVLDKAIGNLGNVRPGDCIVCFSRKDIYSLTWNLEALGHQCAVIYGGLPPGTKYNQAEKFNDPEDPCNVLVATDAIGMGLNLAIKRIIFNSVHQSITKDGVKERELISTSQALQIAGRAGRYGTKYELGEVTTFNKADLPVLQQILAGTVAPIEQVGLHPTADQIEMFAYHLPKATLSNLIDIFVHLCKVDHQNYFMCNMTDFKLLADIVEPIPLPLNVRYVFCCAPISVQESLICNAFLKFARQYSTGHPLTYEWLIDLLNAPFKPPKTLTDLMLLEQAFDVFDLYLWLGYRFPDMFPDMEFVREAQAELDYVIQASVDAITELLKDQAKTGRKAVTIASEKEYAKSKQPLKVSSSVPARKKKSKELKVEKKMLETNSNLGRFKPRKISSASSLNRHFENLNEKETDNLNSATCESAEAIEYTSEVKAEQRLQYEGRTDKLPEHVEETKTKQSTETEQYSQQSTDQFKIEDKEKVHRANVKSEKGISALETSSEIYSKFERDTQKNKKEEPTLTDVNASPKEAEIEMENKTRSVKLLKEEVDKSALSESLKKALSKTERKEIKAVPYRRGKLTRALLENKILTEEMLIALQKEHELSYKTRDTKSDQELPDETEDCESDKLLSAENAIKDVPVTVLSDSLAKDITSLRNATIQSFPGAKISHFRQLIASKKASISYKHTILLIDVPPYDNLHRTMTHYEHLVTFIKSNSNTNLYISAIIPGEVDRPGVSEGKGLEMNRRLRALCDRHNVKYLSTYDINPVYKKYAKIFDVNDGEVHLNSEGVNRLQVFLGATVAKILEEAVANLR